MATIKVEKFIKANPTEVYHYFTNSTALKDWMCDVATADPRPGGHLYLCWNEDYYTSGEYILLENDKSVSFTWLGRGEPHKTRVDVSFRKKRGGTLVKLTHREIGRGKKWAEIAKVYGSEWQNSLENLASVVENGADLRITRRPMLGIYLSDFDATIAAKLGVPVDYGSRLDGVIDGMGAQKAGLLKDDVITAINGHELIAGTSLGSQLGSKHAGDVVDVTFYRGKDKMDTKMTLSGRPIPAMPASAGQFSKEIAEIYKQYENQIEELMDNASEAQCSQKPKPAEWSAKEVIAHLIHNETGWQNFASEIIGGYEGAYDGFAGNLQARVDATLTVFPTKAELLKELKNHNAESVSLLAHLPAEFFTHKGRFWKLVYQAYQNPYHMQIHLEQIKAALLAAKQ